MVLLAILLVIPIASVSAEDDGIKGVIRAESEELKSNEAVFGATNDSTDGFDLGLDIPAPPEPIGEYIEVYFDHPDWPLTKKGRAYYDFMALDDHIEWPLRVAYVANDDSNVTIEWEIDRINGYSIFLKDNDDNILADMEEDDKYEFFAKANNVYEFKIVADKSKAVEGNEDEYDGINDLVEKIRAKLLAEGFDEEEVDNAIDELLELLAEIDIPSKGAFLFDAKEGSIHAIACILPHTPPLFIGESIQCIVISIGGSTINDLHVYANVDSTIIPIQDFDFSPGTIPDPFIWVSDPITLSMAGEWNIIADFTEDGSIVLTVDVTFNVLNEVVIGAIGLIGTSIAAFMIYSYRKKK